jgi:hypothetical protein
MVQKLFFSCRTLLGLAMTKQPPQPTITMALGTGCRGHFLWIGSWLVSVQPAHEARFKHSEGLQSMHWISGLYSEQAFFNSIGSI